MKILLCLLMIAVCGSAGAATIYVDNANGNDTNDGSTEALAKATIAAGITAAGSGGTVYVQGGTEYTPASTVSVTGGITIIGYVTAGDTDDGGMAIIDADTNGLSTGIAITTSTNVEIVLHNITVYGASGNGISHTASSSESTAIMYNCVVRDNGGNGYYASGANEILRIGSTVFADNTSKGVSAGRDVYTYGSLFFGNGSDGVYSPRDVVAIGSVFVNNGGYGLNASASSNYIQFVGACVFSDNTGAGLTARSYQNATAVLSTFLRNGGYGIASASYSPIITIGCAYGSGSLGNTSGTADYSTVLGPAISNFSTDPYVDSYDATTNATWEGQDYRVASDSALFDVLQPVGGLDNIMQAYTSIGPKVANPAGAVYISAPGDLNPTALDEDTASQVAYVLLVDSSDNTTPETGVSSPTITISKAGGAFASPSDGTWTEIGNGLYTIGLDATDTSTAGVLITKVVATGCADDYELLQVGSSTAPSASTVAAAVWDSGQQTTIRTRLTGSDTAVSVLTEDSNIGIDLDDTTGTLDAAEIGGDAITAAKIAADAIGSSEIATDAIGAAEVAAGALVAGTEITGLSDDTDIADAVLDELMAGHTTAGTLGKYIADILEDTGTTLDDLLDTEIAAILEDTGTTIPAAIADLPTDADVNAAADTALTDYDPPTATELAAVQTHGDSAWATATGFSTHSAADVWTAGSRELSTPNNYKADVSGLSTFDPSTTGVNVDSIDTGAITADAIAANAIGASELAADAVAEIDAAWNAALTELTTDPGATPTPRQVLALIYMANRNRVDTTSDTLTYYNDAGEAVFTIGLSDDGTTFTRAEMADAE